MSLEEDMRRLMQEEGVSEALLLFARVMDDRVAAIWERLERLERFLSRRYEAPPE
jgi:hypothetical protein